MIVTRSNFKETLKRFLGTGYYGGDTETTGLYWWGLHKLFSIILTDKEDAYYFNFNHTPDHLGKLAPYEYLLDLEWLDQFKAPFDNPDSTWFFHNAKFDLGMLSKEGLDPKGRVHCTEAMARLIDSRHKSYNLFECMNRLATELGRPVHMKDSTVEEYIKKHGLQRSFKIEGKDKEVVEKYYHKVPFEIISPYGEKDGRAGRQLGIYQINKFKEIFRENPEIADVIHMERQLTKTCFSMEKEGVPVDIKYVRGGLEFELKQAANFKKEYKAYVGSEFVDSGIEFQKFFDKEGLPYPMSEKGNPSFKKSVLQSVDHPVSDVILNIRRSQKLVSTYFSDYAYYSQFTGKIHPNMRQAGTRTGRFSYWDPNLQNVPKPPDKDEISEEEVTPNEVRCCFVPPPEFCLFMPDYDQMEYRMMLDEAEEFGMIKKVQDGMDVHDATVEMMLEKAGVRISRKNAKTINFMLLYGGGIQKLADALGITYNEARELRAIYFAALPRVTKWKYQLIKKTELRGYVKTWFGRMTRLDRDNAYKAPNAFIQGGCADVVKKAMNDIHLNILPNKRTKMLIQVHDELIFGVHKNELELCVPIVEAMERAYNFKYLKLTAGPSYSWKSWGEKIDGWPNAETGNEIQKEIN